ncbi:HAD family hydrolase [Ruficoccus amylovorans]|uniref:phosphoglycolate phosphatase n=1 Tax=Ruficoccus amylovorans TaxID=1804625 RepID=A0A842HER2_9BACT|nr:HAD family hydrolase [Ruficoccus amylovorans]MBC2595085.1 HAD family hydrolase [Ruficoccus amylovorans]
MGQDTQTILFDLDGTLIDHFMTIYRCYRYAQDVLGLEPASYETVRATVGGSVPITMERLVGKENAERAVKLFRSHYAEIWKEDLVALPGSLELLKALHERGFKQAIFTNKEGNNARLVADYLGYTPYLEKVFGTGDTPWRKPQPEFTRHVMETMQADPATTLMIGDSPWDIASAATAGLRCLVVATGSHSIKQLSANDPAPLGAYADLAELGLEFFGVEIEACPA